MPRLIQRTLSGVLAAILVGCAGYQIAHAQETQVVWLSGQGRITIVNGTDDLFLGVYTPNDGPAPANTKLAAPRTGIAFLHGIPAIGTKFDKCETLGPESQKNTASGTYRGTVWFHFD